MFEVSKYFEIAYAHRLYKYPGKCGNIHGHTAKVEVSCSVEKLPKNGMAIDFLELKKSVGGYINENLDHRIILCKDDPLASILKKNNEDLLELETKPSAENLAKLIFDEVKKLGLPVSRVSFWESPTSVAIYKE